MSRDKENYARIESIVELLVFEGLIEREQADAIIDNRDFRELHNRAKKARRGNGPPEFAKGRNGGGNDKGKGPEK